MKKELMTTSLFYRFDFNQEKEINKPFSFEQEELVLVKGSKNKFKKQKVAYHCSFKKEAKWESEQPTIIICIKDNVELLSFTLKNLFEKKVTEQANIVIVDDRSTRDIKSVTQNHDVNYIRVDNDKGFNFSMLNNIGAYVANKLGTKEIILWNSDLWANKEDTLPKLISLHRENNSTISGTKLLYPPSEISFNKEENPDNIKKNFPNKLGTWRETIQFGGSFWFPSGNKIAPHHFLRFGSPTDPRANCNKGEGFVTGAFQIISTKWFIENGGLNPSLSKNFQDSDICLRALKSKGTVFYFGKDLFFYHDESISLEKEGKNDHQLLSDSVLFGKIWNQGIEKLIF